MNLDPLRHITEQNANNAIAQKRHSELLLDNTQTQEIIVKSISKLVDFLDNKTTKTEVVNQLRSIGTPDVNKVVTAVDSLHSTLKTHENTDLSEVTKILSGLLDETKKIPKDKVEIPKVEQKDYVAQFETLAKTVKAVEEAVKAQKLNVEAPVVNVEPVVNVDAPNLKPIQDSVVKGSSEVVKAVKGIKLPEFNTNPLEKLLNKTNKLLEELPELMPSGSGGGGSSWVAIDENGTPMPLNIEGGAITTKSPELTTRIDDTADPIIYIGKATIGSNTSLAVWQVVRLDTTSGLVKMYADGNASFDNVWDDASSLVYN